MPKMAIIGAGPSGLVAAKEALQAGFDVQILEQKSSLGGLWGGGSGKAWESLFTNLTSHSCCFSDFPWEEGTPLYVKANQMLHYLYRYAEHFQLKRHIDFRAQVIRVERAGKEWVILYNRQVYNRQDSTNPPVEIRADYLVIASGIFETPILPSFWVQYCDDHPSLFFCHSQDYNGAEAYRGKTVVIVGGAFTGCELAADLARCAEKVHLLARTVHWVVPRRIPFSADKGKMPLDFVFYCRSARKKTEEIRARTAEEYTALNRYFESIVGDVPFKPPITANPPKIAISDGFWQAVEKGIVEIHSEEVTRKEGDSLGFSQGKIVQPQAIILATGYQTELPFLPADIKQILGFKQEDNLQPLLLYQAALHPDIPNLGFVGMNRGPYFATMELQARLVMRFFRYPQTLPSREEMVQDIQQERTVRENMPRPQFPHGDYVGFADAMAKILAVFPSSEKIASQYGESCAEDLMQTPVIAAHYRLIGEGASPDVALKAIASVKKAYTQAKKGEEEKPFPLLPALMSALGILALGLLYRIANQGLHHGHSSKSI